MFEDDNIPQKSGCAAIPTNTEMVSIGRLPSDYIPYDFDELKIRTFRVPELILISKMIKTKDIFFLIKAIDDVIDQDVMKLTIRDFYYIMYWQRAECYTDTPYYMEWKCDNEVDVFKNGEKTEERRACGHDNLTALSRKSMVLTFLSDCKLNGSKFDKLPEGYDFPRVPLLREIEGKRVAAIQSAKQRQDAISRGMEPPPPSDAEIELEFYYCAQWLQEGKDIEEKFEALKNADVNTFERCSALQNGLDFGVRERAAVMCGECGATSYYPVAMTPDKFLPSHFRG